MCNKCYQLARYHDNPERGRAINAKSYQKNREKNRASQAKWRAANKDRVRELGRRYRQDNRERLDAYMKEWNRENYHRIRASFIRRKFGISLDEYASMLERQNGVCAICHRPETRKRRRHLSVDHDHATGKIRGLLCSACNQAIGLLGDSISVTYAAVRYLTHQGVRNALQNV